MWELIAWLCTPALLKGGLPDDVQGAAPGDEPSAVKALIKDNREARDARQVFLALTSSPALAGLARLPEAFGQVEAFRTTRRTQCGRRKPDGRAR